MKDDIYFEFKLFYGVLKMNGLKKIWNILTDSDIRFLYFSKHGFYNKKPDKEYLTRMFSARMHQKMDWDNPQTYNQKLQWLKLYDRKPIYTIMGDKILVKEYVSKKIGNEYIIPTIEIWNTPDEIDFENLPKQFVLKCNHNSGIGMCVCKNKDTLDQDAVKKQLKIGLAQDYYLTLREWPYKNISRKIIAEEYIGDSPKDYKFFMFNGHMDAVMVCTDRDKGHTRFRFYDKDWNRIYYQKDELEPQGEVERPLNYEKMIQIAEILSKGYPHIRVDLYNQNGKIYFGELTLFDQGGFDTDITYNTDLKWGKEIDLSMVHFPDKAVENK